MGEWSNLTQREKAEVIKFAINNGVSDINTIRDTFNVYAKDSLANVDYNMAAAKAAGFGSNGNGHYPDTFKKPNHPTFSDESIYHSEATPGGRWRGNTYEPSDFVLNQQGGWNQFLRGFYNQEQGTGAVPVFNGGVMLPEIEVRPSPKYKKSSEAYYDPETDTIFAPDSTGEFYTHERFHARPNKEYLQKIAPYYENLNDSVLTSMGADLPFINRNGDPGQYYSPEEIGARVAASLGMLKKAGVSKIDNNFVKESRKNETKYGDNYRDLLHMYSDDIVTDLLNSYAKGGKIYIKPSKRGTFTAAATKHGKSVQEFARQVLANKENYSPAMVKKANFARNFGEHRHDGYSDTQYLRTEQPKVVMPVTGKTADTSWYEWWFANRQKQLQQNIETVKQNERARDFTRYLTSYPNAEEDTERMIKALGETKEYVGNAGMMEDSIGNALARNLLKHQISDYTPDIPDYRVASYLSYLQDGVHLPAYNAVLYPDIGEPPSSTTVTHERAHAADAFFPRAAINYFTTSGEVNPERYDTWYKRIFAPLHPKYPLGIFPALGRQDSYLDDPNEVYSRLMEFRQFVGANPNYTWTKEDLKKYELALEKFRLRRYSDEDILKLLNEIAQSNSSFKKSDTAYIAAFGGNLNSTGGPLYLYPFSFSKNPYWKTPVVRYDDGGILGHQYGIGDFLSKLFAPTYSGDFSTAFASARNNGNSYFKWNGNRYSTQWETEKYREEHPEEYVPEFAYTDAMNRIAREENVKLVKNGYIPELDAWQPHKSVEGGAKTIGYGLKLGPHNQAVLDELERNKSDKYPNGYISDAFALQQSANLLRDEYEPLAKKYWNSTFNDDSWDNLSPKMKSIILDYQYNVRGGIKEFPKLMRAIHDKDYDGIKANYKRYTNRRELGRNKGIYQDLERLFGGYYSVYNN